ncbi:MAG: acetyl-CoA carboxylase carboxyltransferase subunit beta [Calditrichaeota bacterium]|nr:MAG: acetyl-CoA carboxylase carboxyltransferase subunit beta [Calditrichota bacterium]
MAWFKRAKQGLKPQAKRELPSLWVKCDGCGEIIYKRELEKNFYVCSQCQHHFRISSSQYIQLLLDEGKFEEINAHLASVDFLKFKASKKYADQIKAAVKKTGQNDAIRTGFGTIYGHRVVIGLMDFAFIGGSMGSVVGEKIARAADEALKHRLPLIIVSASGGARMMEGAISLMQLAKTSSRLARLADAGLPYISVLTDPTTGGVTASYAMLGDVNLAEPGALIGFAGPRVIKQTIGQDLPDGFQRAEFQLKHGFVDAVVSRHNMKEALRDVLDFVTDRPLARETKNGQLERAAGRELENAATPEKFDDSPSQN